MLRTTPSIEFELESRAIECTRACTLSDFKRIDTIVLVGNPRAVAYGREWRANNSEAYVRRVRDRFAAAGFAVEQRTASGSADCDLLFLARTGCLVPGGGGFSVIAAELARPAGPVVEGDAFCAWHGAGARPANVTPRTFA